jgi:hypothetical protein
MAIGKLVQKDGKLLYSTGDLWSADDLTTCDCNCGGLVPDPCPESPYPLLQPGTQTFSLEGVLYVDSPLVNATPAWTSFSSSHPLLTVNAVAPFGYSGLLLTYNFRVNKNYLPRINLTPSVVPTIDSIGLNTYVRCDAKIYVQSAPISQTTLTYMSIDGGFSSGVSFGRGMAQNSSGVLNYHREDGVSEWGGATMGFYSESVGMYRCIRFAHGAVDLINWFSTPPTYATFSLSPPNYGPCEYLTLELALNCRVQGQPGYTVSQTSGSCQAIMQVSYDITP